MKKKHMSDSQTVNPENPPDVFTEYAQIYARQLLDAIPDLESVAIVVTHKADAKNPGAYCVFDNLQGPLRNPNEIMAMTQNLWKAMNYQLQSMAHCLSEIDHYMAEQATALAALQPGAPDGQDTPQAEERS